MPKRYRLPLFAQTVNTVLGRLDASPDGWFYPRSEAEARDLVERGCQADEMTDPSTLPETYDVVAGVRGRRAAAMVGQSNERGSARNWLGNGSVATTASFEDSTGLSDPISPAVSSLGSVLPHLNARLRARGWRVDWRNCAIGGSSFIKQWTGQLYQWQANTGFFAQRASIVTGDAGDQGDIIVDGTRVFRCTTGRARYATVPTATAIPGYGTAALDYIVTVGTQTTGGTKPAAFATAAVNDVIVDNTVSWTCIATSLGTMTPAFKVLVSGDFGFDPLGLLARTKSELDAVTGVDEKWVFMANGQSDAQASLGNQGTVRGWYKAAIESMANYFLAQGFKVAVGLSCWNPSSTVFNDATYRDQFHTLQLAINDALTTTFKGNGNVVPGGDLYRYFGYNVVVYPEPPATSLVFGNSPHLQASQYPAFADEWYRALLDSTKW